MSLCEDDSDLLLLKFENRCRCQGCPAQIRRAIISFDGVRETRSVDYDKGIAELIVSAEVARNPKALCDWILRKANKHAYVDRARECNTSSFLHGYSERKIKEEIVLKEHEDREIRITRYY